jgi:biopolymer transport protein ExbD
MRRFSQRSHLVTLSEINITPLLDLAFVLLIIFVITTPLLEQSLHLKLPTGGTPDTRVDRRHLRLVEVSPQGVYLLERQRMELAALEKNLVAVHRADPELVVRIRADENGPYKHVAAVLDMCLRNGITRFSLGTEPPTRTP